MTDVETHLQRLRAAGGYRPAECLTCRHPVLHVHQYRERVLRADVAPSPLPIVVYRCEGCRGTWRILPRFLARCLWRRWLVVEQGTIGTPPPPLQPQVPARTARRWRARLAAAACLLVQLLATSGSESLESVATSAGIDARRTELVAEHAAAMRSRPGSRLADLAALVHRLQPGVRLM